MTRKIKPNRTLTIMKHCITIERHIQLQSRRCSHCSASPAAFLMVRGQELLPGVCSLAGDDQQARAPIFMACGCFGVATPEARTCGTPGHLYRVGLKLAHVKPGGFPQGVTSPLGARPRPFDITSDRVSVPVSTRLPERLGAKNGKVAEPNNRVSVEMGLETPAQRAPGHATCQNSASSEDNKRTGSGCPQPVPGQLLDIGVSSR